MKAELLRKARLNKKLGGMDVIDKQKKYIGDVLGGPGVDTSYQELETSGDDSNMSSLSDLTESELDQTDGSEDIQVCYIIGIIRYIDVSHSKTLIRNRLYN